MGICRPYPVIRAKIGDRYPHQDPARREQERKGHTGEHGMCHQLLVVRGEGIFQAEGAPSSSIVVVISDGGV
jgi:hypothetical protein